jgi:hypothetical protein
MVKFDKIAKKFGTDKSSEIHNYCEKYEKWLPFNRLEPLKILEIGVLNGQSLLSWKEFYPNSTIIGIDINPDCKRYENISKNIYIEIGSQNDSVFLETVIQKYGELDLILDDGSHLQSDMIFSFEKLFPILRSECVYIVEDTCTSYWEEFGGGLRKENTSIEYFKNLIDDVNFYGHYQRSFWSVSARREDFLIPQINQTNPEIRTDIESINFLNSVIIITKR